MKIYFLFFLMIYFCNIETGYSKEKILIATESSAELVGESFLISVYGKDVLKQRPFKISSSNLTWMLKGSLNCPKGEVCLGGTAFIEFNKKDGKIIRVNHGK